MSEKKTKYEVVIAFQPHKVGDVLEIAGDPHPAILPNIRPLNLKAQEDAEGMTEKQAKGKAGEILAKAKEDAQSITDKANDKAKEIVAEAEAKALEILTKANTSS